MKRVDPTRRVGATRHQRAGKLRVERVDEVTVWVGAVASEHVRDSGLCGAPAQPIRMHQTHPDFRTGHRTVRIGPAMLDPMDDSLAWAIRAVSPAAVCMLAGNALSLWAGFHTRRVSRWGLRLTILGFALLNIVPGVLTLTAVAAGHLLWPAAVSGATALAFGFVVLRFLRQNWARRPSDST